MTCLEVEPHVSSLYDGEQVPPPAADHIEGCPNCRERLRSYAEIGIEIRLTASRAATVATLPASLRKQTYARRNKWLDFLRAKLLISRFALAALVLVLLTAIPASWTLVRAQGSPLWFVFKLQPEAFNGGYNVEKAGYDDQQAWMFMTPGHNLPEMIGARVAIKSIEPDKAELEVAARNFGTGTKFPADIQQQVAKLPPQHFTYTPNQMLQIPVEGGGTLTLSGQIADHQPKIAFRLPLEPSPNQLIVRGPVLLRGNQLLANLQGANASIESTAQYVFLNLPGTGRLVIRMNVFPGAVPAQVNWGTLTFNWNGESYLLIAAAPISGGEQPHTVWVGLDTSIQPEQTGLGSGTM